ncbi:MAG: hypothetical protein EPO11_00170 [Gammaproteobacteria bacterium]|nr:MAG: hypothetical protein EPO11_00170 [Gammaproteobacteria bacterium]
MERKTKQRILGMLVVVGLVIIMLPLFQSGKELTTEAAVTKAPPFPDQAVQVAAANPAQPPAAPVVAPTPTPVAQQSAPVATAPTPIAQQPVVEQQQAVASAVIPVPTLPVKAEDSKKVVAAAEEPVKKVKHAKVAAKKIAAAKPVFASYNPKKRVSPHAPISNNGLASLKNPAWVIQIGSFKNKTNALRLVNQLRASGYRAFIQQVSTSLGNNTRVFVGPEAKFASAHALANQLESTMRIHGIIISYKPLTL